MYNYIMHSFQMYLMALLLICISPLSALGGTSRPTGKQTEGHVLNELNFTLSLFLFFLFLLEDFKKFHKKREPSYTVGGNGN